MECSPQLRTSSPLSHTPTTPIVTTTQNPLNSILIPVTLCVFCSQFWIFQIWVDTISWELNSKSDLPLAEISPIRHSSRCIEISFRLRFESFCLALFVCINSECFRLCTYWFFNQYHILLLNDQINILFEEWKFAQYLLWCATSCLHVLLSAILLCQLILQLVNIIF